jgi:hypothetical protein
MTSRPTLIRSTRFVSEQASTYEHTLNVSMKALPKWSSGAGAEPWDIVSLKKMQGMSDDEWQEWCDLCESIEAGRLPKWTEFVFWELKGTCLRCVQNFTLNLANNFFLSALVAVPCVHATTLAT